MMKKFLSLFMGIVMIVSCAPDSSKDQDLNQQFKLPENNTSEKNTIETGEQQSEYSDIIQQNFSSPIEMAALMKEYHVTYSSKYLCPIDNVDDYNTDFKKALILGMLSSDLGYLNVYEKTGTILNYITMIKKLADGIRVGQFFDFAALKRLATNNENLDSLMFMSVHSFNQMDEYLNTNNRKELSALMVSGIFVEGLFLITQVNKDLKNEEISETIGEQKIIFEKIYDHIGKFKDDPNFKKLSKLFAQLEKVYKPIQITVEVGDPETKVINGVLTVVQNTTSNVHISDKQLEKIYETTKEVRNKIINF